MLLVNLGLVGWIDRDLTALGDYVKKASESIETGLAERLVYVRTRIGKAATV